MRLSDLFVNGNLGGGVCVIPEELGTNKTGVMEETVDTVLAGKHPHAKKPLLYVGGVQRNAYFYFF